MANRKVTPKTEVNVYNNTSHKVGFELANGRKVYLARNNQFKKVYVDDLDYLLNIAPAMLTEGILYIKDKDIREYLDIEEYYKNGSVILLNKIDELLEKPAEELDKALKKASTTAKKEVAKKASKKKDELTGGQVKAVEKNTKTKIAEV